MGGCEIDSGETGADPPELPPPIGAEAGSPSVGAERRTATDGGVGSPSTPPEVNATTSTSTAPATPPPPAMPPAPTVEPVSPEGVPAAGSVGFRGDPDSLTVIAGPEDAPPGSTWNSQHNYLDVRGDDVVLEGVWVKGGVDYHGSGTLAIRNSIVEGGYGTWLIVMLRDGGGSLDVRDSTLRWKPGSSPGAGSGSGVIQITGNHDDVVILRNDISGNPDGIQVAGDNWTIQENWIHDLAMVGTYPDNTHNDGIQIYNGSGHRIVSNRIEIGARSPYSNSPVFLQGSSIGSVEVHGNLLDGGGFHLYLQNGQVSVIGNTFGPNRLWGDKRVDEGATITAWRHNQRHDGSESGPP